MLEATPGKTARKNHCVRWGTCVAAYLAQALAGHSPCSPSGCGRAPCLGPVLLTEHSEKQYGWPGCQPTLQDAAVVQV
jgi:hypothetical protein